LVELEAAKPTNEHLVDALAAADLKMPAGHCWWRVMGGWLAFSKVEGVGLQGSVHQICS
jgi:hypothetical protein